jgi:hypothetical protein
MGESNFTLVTLVGESRADRYYVRHVMHTYRKFDKLFNVIDVRNYRSRENKAAVTILDRFAMFAAMFYDGVPYKQLLDQLASTKNLVFMTSDLHYWSLFPDLIERALSNPILAPTVNNYDRMFDMFDRLNIRHLITSYSCPELRQIEALRPDLQTYVIDLHVDPAIFKDRHERKKYDVIVYGSTLSPIYAFRHRVLQLLLEARRFRVLHLQPKDQLYNKQMCGAGLAQKINQSWMGLATVTEFNYLLGKYFEIPACRSVVLGDMNSQGAAIFGDHYVHIDDKMSDSAILKVVEDALSNRRRLRETADYMYRIIHDNYTLADNEQKLFEVATRIAGGRARPDRQPRPARRQSDRQELPRDRTDRKTNGIAAAHCATDDNGGPADQPKSTRRRRTADEGREGRAGPQQTALSRHRKDLE